jgi:GMP synthase PP-ATPase subunit
MDAIIIPQKEKQDVQLMNPLVWAYVGDSVYELFIRTHLVNTTNLKVHQLHVKAINYVKAKAQAEMLENLKGILTDEEKENTFIKVINSFTLSTIEPEVGKYYLVFMNYNDDLEHYQVLDDLIYEYDIQNDKTKNTNTNEWEDYKFGVNE